MLSPLAQDHANDALCGTQLVTRQDGVSCLTEMVIKLVRWAGQWYSREVQVTAKDREAARLTARLIPLEVPYPLD